MQFCHQRTTFLTLNLQFAYFVWSKMSVKGIVMFLGMNNTRLERKTLIILNFVNGFLPQCTAKNKSQNVSLSGNLTCFVYQANILWCTFVDISCLALKKIKIFHFQTNKTESKFSLRPRANPLWNVFKSILSPMSTKIFLLENTYR